MKSIFSRKSVSGASALPSSICFPSPLAHHSLLWNPLPANSTASRTGASLAGLRPVGGESPQTVSDSIHGSAMVTPTPRRKVRRENWWEFIELRRLFWFLKRICILQHISHREHFDNFFALIVAVIQC